MISDEAVEAATEILSAYIDVTPDLARELARSQLEAAAPFIAAQAWEEGACSECKVRGDHTWWCGSAPAVLPDGSRPYYWRD